MLSINFIRLKDSCFEKRTCYQPKYTNSCVVCDITLKMSNDYVWKLIVDGHAVEDPVIADIPDVIDQEDITMLCNFLPKIVVCEGNTDFLDILERRIEIKESFPGLSKERIAFIESSLGKTRLTKSNFDTIRHPECFLVVTKSEKCDKCRELRKDLFSIRSKSSKNTQKLQWGYFGSNRNNTQKVNQ